MAKGNSVSNGIYAAVLTPIRSNLTIHHEELFSHANDLIHRGCQGIALFGTTGEGPSFSLKERLEGLEELISRGFDPEKIMLANGSCSIQDTVELAQAGLKHGLLALLISPPSFYKNVSDEGVILFYRTIIQKVANPNLRVILYHIPQFSGVPITLNVITALQKQFPEIVIGIKESEGSLQLTQSILKTFPNLKVFVGKERHIFEAVQKGASGAICGMANLYPELICSLMQEPNDQELGAAFNRLHSVHDKKFIEHPLWR